MSIKAFLNNKKRGLILCKEVYKQKTLVFLDLFLFRDFIIYKIM